MPHRTYSTVNAPWAAPGAYTVRLTVDGKSYNQPLTLRMDPRVTMSAVDMATLNRLTREMYDGAVAARAAYDNARGLSAKLGAASGEGIAEFKARVDALAPPTAAGGGGGRGGGPGGGGNTAAAQTLQSVSASMLAAAMSMQAADVPASAREIAACTAARSQSVSVMARWKMLTTDLAALNAKRKAAGLLAVTMGQ